MNDNLINRLKKDGHELDQLAAKRLAKAARVQPLWEQPAKSTTYHRWFWVAAAVVVLTVGLVTTVNKNSHTPLPKSANITINNPIMLVDEQLKSPLKTEQQAIIDDLKTLKKRFISI